MPKQKIIWRPIDKYKGFYEVSTTGLVRNVRTGLILKAYTTRKGYKRLGLCKNGKSKLQLVHRLVLFAFWDLIPGCPDPRKNKHLQVNHKSGNKRRNGLENLELVTAKENQQHSYRVLKTNNGLQGENQGGSKLKEKDIYELYEHLKNGGTKNAFARMKKVDPSTIRLVTYGKTWAHIKLDWKKVSPLPQKPKH